MATTVKDRVAALRKKRKEMGLVKIEIWTWPEYKDQIKKYAKRLEKRKRREP